MANKKTKAAITLLLLSFLILAGIHYLFGYFGYTALCCSQTSQAGDIENGGMLRFSYSQCIRSIEKMDNVHITPLSFEIVYYKLNSIYRCDYYRNDTLVNTIMSPNDVLRNIEDSQKKTALEKQGDWEFSYWSCQDPEVEGIIVLLKWVLTGAILLFITIPSVILIAISHLHLSHNKSE